eukprot:scaffold1387_cov260-Pinguiococcus_pyrenoidosus.AAC.5
MVEPSPSPELLERVQISISGANFQADVGEKSWAARQIGGNCNKIFIRVSRACSWMRFTFLSLRRPVANMSSNASAGAISRRQTAARRGGRKPRLRLLGRRGNWRGHAEDAFGILAQGDQRLSA